VARLPTPGGDNGNWGTILNDYLSQVHKSDGTLKDDSVTNAAIADDAVNATSIADGSITNALIADGTIAETKLAGAVQTKLNDVGDWNTLSNKPTVIAAGADAAAARTVIGAGISNLTIGTSNTTAKAGDYQPASTNISDSTATGRSLITAASASSARSTISAATKTEVYYATDYGIVADGTTNNASALNSLVTTVSTNGGGVVLLPIGTIVTNSPISMKSNVTLRGHGWTSIIKLGANINGFGVIDITGAISNIVIENLKIDGQRNTLTQLNAGIYGRAPGGYSDILVRNVWVDAVNYGGIIFLGSNTRATITENVRVLDCKVTNVGGWGVLAQWGVDRCWIERCTVVGHGLSQVDTPGITNGRFAYDTHMIDNYVDSTGALGTTPNSVSIDTPYGRYTCCGNTVVNAVGIGLEIAYTTHGSVTGNHVTGGAREGICFTGDLVVASPTNPTNLGVTVANNIVDGALIGIGTRLANTTSAQDIPATQTIRRTIAYTASSLTRVIDGRRIYECTTAGTTAGTKPATWGTTNTGDTVTDGTSVWTDRGVTQTQFVLNGNIIKNCTQNGINIVYAHEFVITNNEVINCGNNGVYIASNANMFTLTGNLIQGNNTSNGGVQAGVWIVGYNGSIHVARIANNLIRNNLTADFVAVDTLSNRLDNRIPNAVTTPTVAYGTTFFTQNTVSTTIVSLVDPNDVDGRVVVIRVNDANTTFQHSASGTNTLRLNGGTNYAAPSGTIIQFMFSSGLNQWIEVSRSSIG
jgi:polygalacturonase